MKNNKVLQWILIKFFTIKGWFKSKKLKKNSTYYGGVNKTYGIYMGNNTFYEQLSCTDNMYGVTYFSTKQVKYNYLQLGLFNWKLTNINIEKNDV